MIVQASGLGSTGSNGKHRFPTPSIPISSDVSPSYNFFEATCSSIEQCSIRVVSPTRYLSGSGTPRIRKQSHLSARTSAKAARDRSYNTLTTLASTSNLKKSAYALFADYDVSTAFPTCERDIELVLSVETCRAKTAEEIGRTYGVISGDKLRSFLGFGEDRAALEKCKCAGLSGVSKY